jgi:sugar lactone lactonase YvrE
VKEFAMRRLILSFFVLLLLAPPAASAQESATPAVNPVSSGLTVIATGLTNPRGFEWDTDGTLYLALAGHGGDTHLPVAPGYTIDNGLSSSVVTVADGCTTPVVQGLVSTLWEEPGWIWGAMDVAFLDDDLYVLVSGAGPSWASPSSRSGVFKVNDDGTMTLVADISTWLPEHPPKVAPPEGPSPDGSLFDLAATSDALLLSDAVNGLIIKVTPAGEISTFADLSDKHPVPTGIAVDADGNAYVGFESAIPYTDGGVTLVKIAPDGTVSDAWTGLTRVADVELGPDGTLYAAELSTGNTLDAPYTYPNTGRIVHQTGPDTSEVIADGLDYPVGLGFGSDGALYVSGPANGANNGEGWLARVEMGDTPAATATAAVCTAMATPTA